MSTLLDHVLGFESYAFQSSSPVTFVVQRYYVHHEHVVAFGIQSGNFDSDGGKHAPCTENYNSN